MLTEPYFIFFCRPEPFKSLYCEVIYRTVEKEREGRTRQAAKQPAAATLYNSS